MADDKQEVKQLKKVANLFFKAVKENASDKEFSELLAKNPKLLESQEFTDKLFPNQATKQKGLVSLDKMMTSIAKVKELADKGIISSEQLETFMKSSNSQTGETFATCAAQQAEAAKEKVNHENPSFSEEGKKKLSDNLQNYEDSLEKMEALGVPMDLPNRSGKTARDIYAKSPKENSDSGNALHVSVNDNSNENGNNLEVGGEEKPALKIKTEEKPVKVNIAEKPKEKDDDEKDADVTNAPEDDAGKKGDYQGSKIGERDIIDYMYNEWFLASVDWAVNGVVGWVVGGVDNLCEKFDKKCKDNSNKTETRKDKISEFKKSGQYLLTEGAKKTRDCYAADKAKELEMWKEIAGNLGKDPQTWNKVNPKDTQSKLLIDNINAEYKKNPKQCTDKINNIIQNHEKNGKGISDIYAIAVEISAAEMAYEGMNSGRLKRGVKFQYNLGDLESGDIDAKLKKKSLEKAKELYDNTEKLKLAVELKMAKEGVTDKKQIEQAQAKYITTYLQTLANQTVDCQNKLLNDLKNDNFSYANTGAKKDLLNKGLSDDAKKSYKAMSELTNMDKLGDAILAKEHKKIETMGLEAEAKERFTATPIESLNKQFSLESAQHNVDAQQHQTRKDNLQKWKDNVLKSDNFNKEMNNSNSVFNNIWNKMQGNSK